MKIPKLKIVTCAFFSLFVVSTAFAGMDDRLEDVEKKLAQVGTSNPNGTYGTLTASASPQVKDEGWFLSFDVLRWHAYELGTEYAYTNTNLAVATQLPVKGHEKSMSFDWDYGIKIGLGYRLPHDNWDLFFQYTWFDTSGSDTSSGGLNSHLAPLNSWQDIIPPTQNALPSGFNSAMSAKLQFDLTYKTLQVELGRNYYVSSKVSFRPHYGLITAWIDQSQITRFTGGDDLDANTVHIKDNSDFWGLGPRTGFESKWYFGYDFSFFGNIAAALAFGHFDVDHREKSTDDADHRIKVKSNQHAFSPTVEFALGLAFDRYIHDKRQHLSFTLGYESHYWWRQNQFVDVDENGDFFSFDHHSEDLGMHGVTLMGRLDF